MLRFAVLVTLGLTVAACGSILKDMRENQAAGRDAANVAMANQVAEVCQSDPAECVQAQAILGHACFADSRRLADTAKRTRLDCAVDNLSAAITTGLPDTVGNQSKAVYEATYMEALNQRMGMTATFAEAAPYLARLDAAADAFERDYPQDWHGPYYAAQAHIQAGNVNLVHNPAQSCASFQSAADALARADGLDDDPRIDQAADTVQAVLGASC